MKKNLLILILFTISLFSVNESYATHAAAVDLTYECLGGNRYVFTLKVYRDCSGAALGGAYNINLRSTLCGENFNFNMARTSITEVSQVCDAVLPNTACSGGPLPGIEEHTYTDTVTLPANCTDWIGSYTLCCRNNSITNVNNGNLYSEVRIDNSGGQCNNSPQFNSGVPILFGCVGLPINYNNAAFDPDGDSLTYQLVNPWSANNTPLAYLDPSFNPTNPMFTTSGFNFDPVTGQISFTSPSQQVVVVSILVSEYDSLGNFKGSTRRDLQFVMINCPDIDPPTVTGVDYDTTGTPQSFEYNACFTDSFCFEIYGLSGTPGTPVDLIYNGGFPGGLFSTTTSGDTTFGTFCWNPGTRVGDYFFTIRAEADVCPAKVINVYNYTINIDTNFTICTDTTIYLDATGAAYVDSTYVIGDENSPCQFAEVNLDQNTFTCADLGANVVGVTSTFTANNLVKSCNSIITVLDTLPPMAICQDTTIVLDATGNFTIDSSFIDDGTNDNCGLDRITLSRYTFSCTDIGVNVVTLYATDIYGNMDSCTANVTVVEETNPVPVCQDTTIYLNAAGNFTIDSSFIDDGSTDNCGVERITLSNYTYTCAEIGTNIVTMYVTDSSGNIDSCTATVTVVDSIRPTAICQDTTIYLNATGNFTIDSSFIDDGSSDNCAVATITIDQTTFNCTNIGVNPVVITVTDVSGNINTCNATLTIVDSTRPTAVCQDTTIYLNATGTFTIDSSYINNGSLDNCAVSTITLDRYTFNCIDTGINAVVMTVTDVNGNVSTCMANVTVRDTTNPTVLCRDTTIYLDAAGTFTIDSSFIDNGSSDPCDLTLTLSQYVYTCAEVGANNITLYARDANNNVDSCTAVVTVIDSIRPTPVCKDTTIYLNAVGTFVIDSSYINDGSSDNCAIATITLDQVNFDCSHVGTNPVVMTVTDVNGNVSMCNANVIVVDSVLPTPICKDTTLYLDATGNFVIDSSFVNNGSNDNCGIATITLSQYAFNCSDTGLNAITMTVTDVNGNIDSCIGNITIIDTVGPVALCRDTTIYLDLTGSFTIDSSYIDNGSTDACGVITISQSVFTCAEVGANNVTLYVTDANNNIDSCTGVVTVIDSIRPTALCNDTTIYLNAGGTFVIDTSFINNGSYDNCDLASVTASQTNFDCSHVGVNIVTLTVTDVNGNVSTCNANVTVVDSLLPTPICRDRTLYLDVTGNFVIDSSDINNGSTDNCGIATITLSQYAFNCADTGTNQITMYVTDDNGNVDSCLSNITVIDTVGPVAICQDTTVYIDFTGQVTIDSSFIDNGSTDACGIITLSRSQFFCADTGVNVVTLYVTDGNGNRDSCNANVTVLDTIVPFVRCKDTLVYLDAAGQFAIDSSYVDDGSSDLCQILRIRVDPPVLVCNDLGVRTVFMIVEDVNGNLDTCIPNVTVIDTLIPTPICQDTTVYLNNLGVATIDSSFVDNGSFDNCTVATITLSKYDFNCGDTGVNVVTMYVTDNSGNIDSCVGNVTIVDTTGPVALCRDTTIYLDAVTGQFTIDSSYIDGGSTDACGVLTISQSLFDCSHIGPNNVTLYVTDANNNMDSCVGVVTVLDTVRPNAVCNDTTVYLNAAGQVIIDSSFIAEGSSDACGVLTISISNNTFNCADTGVNMVTVIVTDVNGNFSTCVANVTVRDTIIPLINAGLDDSLCSVYTYTLNGNAPTGTLQGTWSTVSGPNVPAITNPTIYNSGLTGLIEGVYEFEWLITNGPGCNISRDTVVISVFNNPIANAGADSSLCNVYSMGMRADVPAGTSTGVWSFVTPIPSIPAFTDATNPSTVVSNLDEGTYTFVWTVSNGICSPVTDTMIIEVYDLPIANAGQDVSLCATYNALLVGNTPAGRSTGMWSYVNGPNVPVITAPTNPVTGVNSMVEGTYTLVWTVSNGVCDPATDTILINIYDQPVADAGANQNLCAVYNTNLDGNIPPGTATGRWVVAPGSIPPSIPAFADSSVYNTNVSNLQEGRYELIWIISNGVCPNDADTVIIDVWDRPVADVGPDTNLCSTYDLQLYAAPVSGLTQGFWTLNAAFPNPNVPNIVNGGLNNATVLGMTEGQYEFIWRVTNGPCFVFADTLRVNVFDQPTANAGFDQDLCYELSTLVSANAPVGTASGQWILTSGIPNTPTFNPSAPSTSVTNLQEAGVYRLMWEMRNGTCPVSRDTVQINNFAVPVTNFTQDSLEICAGDCIGFSNLSTIHPNDNITSYRWFSGGSTYFGEDPTMCWPFAGIYDVQLITESSNGCSDTLVRNNLITVNTVPIADFNVFLVDDEQVSTKIQIVDQSQFSTSYSYDLGDGTTSSIPNLTHTYADSGFYDIVQVVSNSFGCKDTLTRTIFVQILLVYVPNTFTPDGDGVNDGFIPSVNGDDPDSYLFRVFDRWGELIFQTQAKGKPWDGTYKGQPAKTDSYVWTLKTKYRDGDRIKEYRGHVNLLR